MFSDITIGQYFPGDSFLHRADPRMKLILTFVFIVIVYATTNRVGLIIGMILTILGYTTAKIPAKMVYKSIKPVLFLIVFTAIMNMFFIEGDPIWSFWKLTLTKQGLIQSVAIVIRTVCMLAGSSLLPYTTTPIALTDAIERVLQPLKIFKLPVHELAMMMTIALRFIPIFIDQVDIIMNAQKARGADIDTGGFLKRAKALIPVLIPLFVSAIRSADELALAMDCRCYHGGEGRTRMTQLKMKPSDIILGIFMVVCLTGVILINIFSPIKL